MGSPAPQSDPWAAVGLTGAPPEAPDASFADPASGRKRIIIRPSGAKGADSAAADDPWASVGLHDEGTVPGPEPHKFGLGDTWPARMVKSAVNAFGGAMGIASGEIDPHSDEAIKSTFDLATLASPMNPAVRAGDRAIPGLMRRGPVEGGATEGQGAALTANELGAPLPIGLASDNPAVQAVTQAARQLPGVGTGIDTQVGKTVTAAGQRVNEMASDLGGGVIDRTAAGANLRPSLQGVINDNNARIDQAFDSLRGMINPDKVVKIARAKTMALPQTKGVLQSIVDQRMSGGSITPVTGLGEIDRLSTYGASFNGLQRARHDISNIIKFGQANPGFDQGDLKRLYGAMTGDLANIARAARKSGVKVGDVSDALQTANGTAQQLITHNNEVQKLLGIKNDEGLIGSVVKLAQGKTGNAQTLARLRATMPKEDFEQISATALAELGHKTSTGEFSLNQFVTNWNKMGDQAKSVLFSREHRGFLENIAQLGSHLKDADKYLNTSGTGRAAMTGGVVASAGPAAIAAIGGNPVPMLGMLGSLGGGYALARVLARPAGAAAIARWSRAASRYEAAPNPATRAAVVVAARSLISNVTDITGLGHHQLMAPVAATP